MIPVFPLVPGDFQGEVIALDEPVSFWGGVDPATGRIVEAGHPQQGESLTGRIVAMSHGRGSSSSSSILTECLRLGTGPGGIVLQHPDSILIVGSLVADQLYGVPCPIVASPTLPQTGEIWSLSGHEMTRMRTG